jgi:flavodoxin
MKTVIIYASVHHNNTKELVCAIAAENDIDVVDATKITEKDLSGYDLIGFASGIYFGKLHQSVINFAEVNLPENKDVFLICTYGGKPVFDTTIHTTGTAITDRPVLACFLTISFLSSKYPTSSGL